MPSIFPCPIPTGYNPVATTHGLGRCSDGLTLPFPSASITPALPPPPSPPEGASPSDSPAPPPETASLTPCSRAIRPHAQSGINTLTRIPFGATLAEFAEGNQGLVNQAEAREMVHTRTASVALVGVVIFFGLFASVQGQDRSAIHDPQGLSPDPAEYRGVFRDVVLSGGLLGVLNWGGIFLSAVLGLPLGIASVIHSTKTRTHHFPLSLKLLICGGVWAFLLGLVGTAQGSIYACCTLAQPVSSMVGQYTLFMDIAYALYSLGVSLLVCQCYLLLVAISVVVLHFRHRKLHLEA